MALGGTSKESPRSSSCSAACQAYPTVPDPAAILLVRLVLGPSPSPVPPNSVVTTGVLYLYSDIYNIYSYVDFSWYQPKL